MWRRKLFFWLDRLNITPAERNTILIVAVLLISVSLFNLFLRQRQIYQSSDYRQMREIFRKKLALARKKDSLRKVKYYTAQSISGNKDIKVTFNDSIRNRSVIDSHKKNSKNRLADTLISINKAGLNRLMFLTGIGPKTARKIINYRGNHGPFRKLDSIKKVKGIGEKKFEKIKSHISL